MHTQLTPRLLSIGKVRSIVTTTINALGLYPYLMWKDASGNVTYCPYVYIDPAKAVKQSTIANTMYAGVGGTLSQASNEGATFPLFSSGAGEDTIIQEYFQGGSIAGEGASVEARYVGRWLASTGVDSCRIRAYLFDGATPHLFFDTGNRTPNSVGISGDEGSTYDGAPAYNGWTLDLKVMNWRPKATEYILCSAKFNQEAPILCPAAGSLMMPYSGESSDFYIMVTFDSTTAGDIAMYGGNTYFFPHGDNQY